MKNANPPEDKTLLKDLSVTIGEKTLSLSLDVQLTYASQPIGTPLALFDSQERLEISVNQGNASRFLSAQTGHQVVIQ